MTRDIAYYMALLNAWIETKMERDRMLLRLSAYGIGVLVFTLVRTTAISHTVFSIYAVALSAFATTIVLLLYIFGANAKYLESTLKRRVTGSYELKRLDKWTLFFFIVGLLFTFILISNIAAERLIEGP